MLDLQGFVAETNSANVFIVKGNWLATPRRDACMPGITRAQVLRIGASLGWETQEENLSLTDVYTADEMSMSGTVCEIVPVTKVDGRRIGDGEPGDRTLEMLGHYLRAARTEGTPVG
jgi:branched-chain amino acid aminotransferase